MDKIVASEKNCSLKFFFYPLHRGSLQNGYPKLEKRLCISKMLINSGPVISHLGQENDKERKISQASCRMEEELLVSVMMPCNV